jgi:hypothetical protein
MSRGRIDALARVFTNLGQLAFDEALAAEAGIDAHDQDQVDQIHQIVQASIGVRDWKHHAAFCPAQDMLQRAMDMRPAFGMHGEAVGPGIGESLDIGIDRRDHQMDVEGLLGVGPERRSPVADGDVGTKWPSITSTWIQSAPRGAPRRPHSISALAFAAESQPRKNRRRRSGRAWP